ncbi:hypothetical protein OG216_09630 [Streptomycetaceae bacterium NBC_01309]
MPRIRLAHWHDGHKPGDEIDVDDDTCKALKRDGRVAEVLPDFAEGGMLPSAASEAVNETGEPEQVVPAPRKRRASQEE